MQRQRSRPKQIQASQTSQASADADPPSNDAAEVAGSPALAVANGHSTSRRRSRTEPAGTERQVRRSSEGQQSEPDETKRRQLRTNYNSLIDETQAKRTDLVVPGTAGLLQALERGNELFEDVDRPREATRDSALVKMVAELGVLQGQRMQSTNQVLEPRDFVAKLKTFEPAAGGEDETPVVHWAAVGRRAAVLVAVAPAPSVLLGALELPPRASRPLAERHRKEAAPVVVPDQGAGASDQQAAHTARRVQALRNCLVGLPKRQCNLFRLLIDPQSFPVTVENFFHISFLIKEGHVRVELQEHEPMAVAQERPEGSGGTGGTAVQCIFTLNEQLWRAAIRRYGITEAMLSRPTLPSQTAAQPQSPSQSQSQSQSQEADSNASARSSKRNRFLPHDS